MVRHPEAAERHSRGQTAEEDSTGQGRGQEIGLTLPPGDDVIDLESDTQAEQHRQRNDVREI